MAQAVLSMQDYITERIENEINIDDICAVSGYSKRHNFDVVLCLGAFYHLHNKKVFLPKLTNINFMIEFIDSYLADKFMLRCFFEDVLHIELEKRYRKRAPEYRNYAEIFYDYIEGAFS